MYTSIHFPRIASHSTSTLNTSKHELSFILVFILAPLNITQSLTEQNVLLGQSGTLQITCDAFPVPKVTWYDHYPRI